MSRFLSFIGTFCEEIQKFKGYHGTTTWYFANGQVLEIYLIDNPNEFENEKESTKFFYEKLIGYCFLQAA